MLDTLLPRSPGMAKKVTKSEPAARPRFKDGSVPAEKRRATLALATIKVRLQEIRDELGKIEQCLVVAAERGADSLYLDGATKADTAAVQLLIFRQKVERAVLDLSRP